jgi:hypothetical protein
MEGKCLRFFIEKPSFIGQDADRKEWVKDSPKQGTESSLRNARLNAEQLQNQCV